MSKNISKILKNKNFLRIIVVVVAIVMISIVLIDWKLAQAPILPASEQSALSDPGTLLANATYSLYGDTFTLVNGKAIIQGHGFATTSASTTTLPLVPIGYTIAATSSGTISSSGQPGAVAALYRGFGANLEWTTLFVFAQNADGTIYQVASDVAYQGDAKVVSVSINKGIITLNLLVVSAADQQKPHYEQTPTQPEMLRFGVFGNQMRAIATSSAKM